MERVIGIDLGTTNSCVAVMENEGPIVIPNRGGYKTTPSMVAVTETGKRLVGHIAKRQAITNAENTIFAAKRLIGRKWEASQVKNMVLTSSYRISEGPHGDARIQLRGQSYSIPEISAMVLQEMKAVAEGYLNEPVSKAVITVPAYFNDHQRQATKDAGQIAGLDVLRIINEPTAAALAYGFNKNVEKTIAVYDLGGGTFDISLLEIGKHGVFKVLATAGDTFLGGEDFDGRIIDWLVQSFKDEHGLELRQDRMALQRLKDAAEKAKCELSATAEADVNLPFIISNRRNEALHLQRVLSRKMLDELCEDLVERTIEICKQTLADAKLTKQDIEDVVLVGGMTRMPRVQRAVADFFGREPSKNVHPDEVVALGAAVQAYSLVHVEQDMLLLDVTPHALGIMTFGSRFEALIPQNTTVPTSRAKSFTTSRDNQTAVKILVMQGEEQRAEDNELLGEFILTGLRAAPKGEVEIEVTFSINADGIVSVQAKDMGTGQQQSIQVTATSGLTPEEIAHMVQEAQEYGVQQKISEEAERMLQEAQTMIADIERLFPEVEQIVLQSDFGRNAIEKARTVISKAREAVERRDVEALKIHLDPLARTQRMFRNVVTKTA